MHQITPTRIIRTLRAKHPARWLATRRVLAATMSLFLTILPLAVLSMSAEQAAGLRGTFPAGSPWAGYAVRGGPYLDVRANWRQPEARCGLFETSRAVFWVGLDGYQEAGESHQVSLLQIGTAVSCDFGVPGSMAWSEVLPDQQMLVPFGDALQPGDAISAEVHADDQRNVTLSLRDLTQHWAEQVSAPAAQFTGAREAPLGSAEIVAEQPTQQTLGWRYHLPLTSFGAVDFTQCAINGEPLGAFAPLDRLAITNASGESLAGATNLFGADSFSDYWFAGG